MAIPLFVCHANCCRSVLASYLYRHLSVEAPVLSAGFEPGERISGRAGAMLAHWGIDARDHRPRLLQQALRDEAHAIFVMAPTYMHRLFLEYGQDLATRTYLFADPFSVPQSFTHGEHRVYDPSFDDRPTDELVRDYCWMRERVWQLIHYIRSLAK
jgi:protein-tyrosine-phosphatase